ncbi:MAG: type IX secretion system outer membrane channel protein PorV [Crocinitomicaceae bacterium]
MFKKIIFSIIALTPMAYFAQPTSSGVEQSDLQLNTITTALPFMSITPDSRAGGMGDAGTALSPSSMSIYWNTSNLIFSKDKNEIGLSYVPWLRQLTNDIHLSYLSGYHKISDRHVIGGAMRYFSLGAITFTDGQANYIREDKPAEFQFTGSYAFRLSERMAIGVNGSFANSNLTGGLIIAGIDSKPARAGAADLSFTYFNDNAKFGKTKGTYTFAATINNIGNKVAYSSLAKRDFIPTNLKIGNAFKFDFDEFNSLTWSFELQKLLVPTPPRFDKDGNILAGKQNDVGVIAGMLQSFTDAPGAALKDENNKTLYNEDGTEQIKKNTRLGEELNEINLATGVEYWYNKIIAIRAGIFYEAKTKGDRQFYNAGVGLKYNAFMIDISYLGSLNGRQSPLANTLRFTLRMTIGN